MEAGAVFRKELAMDVKQAHPQSDGATAIPRVDDATMAAARVTSSGEQLGPTQANMVIARQYGPIYRLPGTGPRRLQLTTFALADEVCNDQMFDKKIGLAFSQVRVLLGDGLFSAYTQEPNWHKAHNILLPNFSLQAMKSYMPEMLDPAGQLMLKWKRLNPGDEIDVPGDMTRLTVETIGLCGFGYRFNAFYRDDQHPFIHALLVGLSIVQESALSGKTPDQTAADPQMQQALSVMNSLVDEVIALRKAGGAAALAAHKDLLDYMLTGVDRQTKEGLDDTTIRYEILTFMVAGHETTSGTLSFALYYLLKHPDVMARAYEEVDRVLGNDLSAAPTYDQVHRLTYLAQIFKETLRLWPPVPALSRYAYQPTTLGGKYPIMPEDEIVVLTPMLHRDPAIWGNDAEEFNPDHFSPEAEEARPANAWLPFGIGQRACIGRQFALQEATLALGMMLQRFELVDHTQYQLTIRQAGTIKPQDFLIQVRHRPGRTLEIPSPVTTSTPADATAAAPEARRAPNGARPDHNTPLLILFGSNLGASEDVAQQVANDAGKHGFTPTVAPLDDYTGKLPTEGAVVIVTASYNGTPPDNAVTFCTWLRDDGLSTDALRGVRYTVFGCGNREWRATYQAVPKLVDSELAAHGAQRIYQLGEGDVGGDFDDAFHAWEGPLWTAMASALSIELQPQTAAETALGRLYTVELVSVPANPILAANGIQPLTIRANRELQTCDGGHASDRSTRHLEFLLPDGMTYQTGDHLGVMPRNGVTLVTRVLARFGYAGDAFIRIRRNGVGTPVFPLDQPVFIIELLTHYVELQEVASRAQIQALADYTECPPDKAALLMLADPERYKQEVLDKRITLLDLLERFPACELPFHVYLEMMHPLRLRYYSISSSPLEDARKCSITVAVVQAPARSGNGTYEGIASTYLARHPEDSVVDGCVRSPHIPFRPPKDATIPLIMIGPGTGVAPFRGFLQERAALKEQGKPLGPALLFFGCRHADQDYIYRAEMEAYAAQGVATLYTAFSRIPGHSKSYVQDLLKQQADQVWQLLQDGAIVFVSGDAGSMEPAVRATLQDIYASKTGATAEAAETWQKKLTSDQRYLADVWAHG
ncbi:MAG: bifunctional cytochrome P450/NADPH--P450 reductase [Ktedonobacterales bacterium]